MLDFINHFLAVISFYYNHQIGGYLFVCDSWYNNLKKTCLKGQSYDTDLQSFRSWLCGITEDDEDEAYCIASCEPEAGRVPAQAKQISLQGKVTSVADDYGLIDHYIYFHFKDIQGFGNNTLPTVGDLVHVDAEQVRAEGGWKAKHVVLLKEEKVWDENDDDEFRVPTTHEGRGLVVGQVTSFDHKQAEGTIEDTVTFSLSDIYSSYKPVVGDWVQACVTTGSIASDVKPVRTKQMTASITSVPQKEGVAGAINEDTFFELSACFGDYVPRRGDQVAVTAIESKRGRKTWRATEVKYIGRSTRQKMLSSQEKGNQWILRGEKPKLSSQTQASLPSFLPQFGVPKSLRTCIQSGGNLLALHPKLGETLSADNYTARFSALLHLEELQVEAEIQKQQLHNVTLHRKGEFLVLLVPGLSDRKRSLFIGDTVILKPVEEISGFGGYGPIEHHGCIHHILMESEELYILFHKELYLNFDEDDRFDAAFTYSRTPFRRCHFAVKLAKESFVANLFPYRPQRQVASLHCNLQFRIKLNESNDGSKFFNTLLNERQKAAVQRILEGAARPKPYILFGPPGTGKTVTLVEAILQVVTHIPSCRILVCAPSNSAVDLLCERLHDSGKLACNDMVRFNAYRRPPEVVPEQIRQYCHVGEALLFTARYKVVLTTCVNAGTFYALGLSRDHFTHVYVDEAGQATEPECLIPVGLGASGQIVLTGDPQQLGAVLMSSYANHYGLGLSLLERLMKSLEYSRNDQLYSEGYNPVLVTKLINNYRSHPCLMTISSKIFYDDELVPCAPESLSLSFANWEHLPTLGFPSIFHGVTGSQLQEENSPSWFNAEEIVQICRYVKLLLNNDKIPCNEEDIGVITPYRKQVEKMRMMFKALNVARVKIGSVEEFQGQERKIILLSTVRSTRATQYEDSSVMTALGFLANPKRFNVSITRAIALMIIVGNPIVLVKDAYWRKLLKHHVDNTSYVGCDISSIMNVLQE